jgi:hypothetical protein
MSSSTLNATLFGLRTVEAKGDDAITIGLSGTWPVGAEEEESIISGFTETRGVDAVYEAATTAREELAAAARCMFCCLRSLTTRRECCSIARSS